MKTKKLSTQSERSSDRRVIIKLSDYANRLLLDGKGKVIIGGGKNKFYIFSFFLLKTPESSWLLQNRLGDQIQEFSSFEIATTAVICYAHGRFDLFDKICILDQQITQVSSNLKNLSRFSKLEIQDKKQHQIIKLNNLKQQLQQTLKLTKYLKFSGTPHEQATTN